jgi:hypothetical protein
MSFGFFHQISFKSLVLGHKLISKNISGSWLVQIFLDHPEDTRFALVPPLRSKNEKNMNFSKFAKFASRMFVRASKSLLLNIIAF